MTKKLLIWSLLSLASITPLLTSASNSASINYSCWNSTNCVNGMQFWEVDISTLDWYVEDSLNTVCYELRLNSSTNLNSFTWGITNINMSFDSYFVNWDNAVVVSQCDWMFSPNAGPVIIDDMNLWEWDATASFTITYSLPAWDSWNSWGWNSWGWSDWDLRGEESYNGYVWSMSNVSWNLSSSIVSFIAIILQWNLSLLGINETQKPW